MSKKTILSILPESSNDGILGTPTHPVESVHDKKIEALVQDLIDTMHTHPICVGLAAPQIGSDLRIAVVNLKNEDSTDLILVNPRLISTSGKKDIKFESCMSLPGWRGYVERRKKAIIEWQDTEGVTHEEQFEGFLARAILHEIDHLDGLMFHEYDKSIQLEQTDLFDDYIASEDPQPMR